MTGILIRKDIKTQTHRHTHREWVMNDKGRDWCDVSKIKEDQRLWAIPEARKRLERILP